MTPPLGDRKSRRTTHALLAAALVAATVFLRVPTDLYHSSARDFASASRDILLTIFAAGALLFAVLALLFLALPARLKGPAAALLIVLASYAWVRSAFFPGPSLSLDGTRLTADLSTGVAGALLPPLTAILLAWLAVRQPRGVTTFLALVLAGSLVHSIAATAAAWRVRPPTAPAAAAAALQWFAVGELSCAGAVRHFASHRLRIPRPVLARSQDVTTGFRLRSSGGDSGENVRPEPCLALQTLELRPAS